MNKRVLVSIVILMFLSISLMPVASAYSGKVHLPPFEDGVPGEYVLKFDAHWGDKITWWFKVDRGAVNFLIFRPNLQGHYSISTFDSAGGETIAPETGTYMLVWRNKEALGEKVLQIRVDIEPRHLSLLIAVVAFLVIIGVSLIYIKWKRFMRELDATGSV